MSCAKYGKSRFLIIYASQTGQAKAIAEEIVDRALEHNLKPALFCMSLTDKKVRKCDLYYFNFIVIMLKSNLRNIFLFHS